MKNNHVSVQSRIEQIIAALLFATVGGLIYIVFSPLRPLLDKTPDYLGRIGLIALLLVAVLAVNRSGRYRKFGPILLGLLIMSVVVSLDWVSAVYLMEYLGVNGNTPAGFALLKLNEGFVVVSGVAALTLLSGGSLGSIYIQKGKLKLGLLVGGTAFVLAAAGSTLMAGFLFKGQNLTFERIVGWLPWVLIFVLANAAQEELLCRGLFLRKLQPFFGKFFSNVLVVFVFVFLHQGASYSSDDFMFLIALVLLGFVWGYLTQKTDSIWGSILFHAGMDIPVILGIFSNL